jgi:hypothetical protein
MKFAALFFSFLLLVGPAAFAAKKNSTQGSRAGVHKSASVAKKAKKRAKKAGPKLQEGGKKMKLSPPKMSHAPKTPELPKQEGDSLPAPQISE